MVPLQCLAQLFFWAAAAEPRSAVRSAPPPDPIVTASSAEPSAGRRGRRRTFPAYSVMTVANGATIEGTVTYDGPVPSPRKIAIVKDHETCGVHASEVPAIRLGAEGRVAEAVVYLADIAQGRDFPKLFKPPQIDQRGCEFRPHVQVVPLKHDVEIINSDPVAHNIKADQRIYTLFNVLQPSQGMRSTRQFEKAGLVELRCNVHDWMRAFVYVLPHPYFAVTGEEGSFRLENVPPGEYTLVVWQESLGEHPFPVVAKSGESTQAPVVLKPVAGE